MTARLPWAYRLSRLTTGCCVAVALVMVAAATILATESLASPSDSSGSSDDCTLFAFDNVSIPFTHNLRLEMQQPEKYPDNPVVRRGPPGTPDEFGVQFYGSIIRDNDLFRLWYVAVDRELERNSRCVRCWRPAYAESRDGIHWEKPDLGLVEYKGNKTNNLVRIDPAPLGMINLKVLHEPDDPDPGRRYKMSAHTWWWDGKRRGRGTLAPLFSRDGVRWHLAIDTKPVGGLLPVEDIVLPPHHFEAAGGLYKWQGMYFASGQSGPPQGHGMLPYSGREVLMHRSPDFVHWSKTASVGFVRSSQRASFAYGTGEESHEGVSVWNRNNVLIGIYGRWHGAKDWRKRTIDLGLLISNDGVHFREPLPEWTFLRRGEDGQWDQGGLLQGQGFENVGDKTLVWYGAWDPRDGQNYQPRGGVGLATLPRDRFGALSVDGDGTAELVTSTVSASKADPRRLWLNVDGLGEESILRVELLDERERPLRGYSGEHAAIVRDGGFRTPVVWAAESQSTELPDRFRVRVFFEGEHPEKIRFHAAYVSS